MDPKPSCLDGGPIPSTSSPIVEQRMSDTNNARFFIMKKSDSFSNVSPFLIEKAITASVGSVKTIRKMRSGDLFLEVSSAKQVSALINLRQLANFEVTVAPHRSLNFSRGKNERTLSTIGLSL
ncbi:hypothetical protein NPIL_245111 [Nephila pilipes]|uniref:Uncharacterized protein n=1 Tax=Nephila pilipes TaxID=299642 RepID=A0A8X6QBK8_NEPPI|nr:hypothetical protein NPIL_245111 [Nephila pilipes]